MSSNHREDAADAQYEGNDMERQDQHNIDDPNWHTNTKQYFNDEILNNTLYETMNFNMILESLEDPRIATKKSVIIETVMRKHKNCQNAAEKLIECFKEQKIYGEGAEEITLEEIKKWFTGDTSKIPEKDLLAIAKVLNLSEERKHALLISCGYASRPLKELITELFKKSGFYESNSNMSDSEIRETLIRLLDGKVRPGAINQWMAGNRYGFTEQEEAYKLIEALKFKNDDPDAMDFINKVFHENKITDYLNEHNHDVEDVVNRFDDYINKAVQVKKGTIKRWTNNENAYLTNKAEAEDLADFLFRPEDKVDFLQKCGALGNELCQLIVQEMRNKNMLNPATPENEKMIDILYNAVNEYEPEKLSKKIVRHWIKGKDSYIDNAEDVNLIAEALNIPDGERDNFICTCGQKGNELKALIESAISKHRDILEAALGDNDQEKLYNLVNGNKPEICDKKTISKWIDEDKETLNLKSEKDKELLVNAGINAGISREAPIGLNDLKIEVLKCIKIKKKYFPLNGICSLDKLTKEKLVDILYDAINEITPSPNIEENRIQNWLSDNAYFKNKREAEAFANSLRMNEDEKTEFLNDCGEMGEDLYKLIKEEAERYLEIDCSRQDLVSSLYKRINGYEKEVRNKETIKRWLNGEKSYLDRADDPVIIAHALGMTEEEEINDFKKRCGEKGSNLYLLIRDYASRKDASLKGLRGVGLCNRIYKIINSKEKGSIQKKTIREWFNGKKECELSWVKRFADYLNLDADERNDFIARFAPAKIRCSLLLQEEIELYCRNNNGKDFDNINYPEFLYNLLKNTVETRNQKKDSWETKIKGWLDDKKPKNLRLRSAAIKIIYALDLDINEACEFLEKMNFSHFFIRNEDDAIDSYCIINKETIRKNCSNYSPFQMASKMKSDYLKAKEEIGEEITEVPVNNIPGYTKEELEKQFNIEVKKSPDEFIKCFLIPNRNQFIKYSNTALKNYYSLRNQFHIHVILKLLIDRKKDIKQKTVAKTEEEFRKTLINKAKINDIFSSLEIQKNQEWDIDRMIYCAIKMKSEIIEDHEIEWHKDCDSLLDEIINPEKTLRQLYQIKDNSKKRPDGIKESQLPQTVIQNVPSRQNYTKTIEHPEKMFSTNGYDVFRRAVYYLFTANYAYNLYNGNSLSELMFKTDEMDDNVILYDVPEMDFKSFIDSLNGLLDSCNLGRVYPRNPFEITLLNSIKTILDKCYIFKEYSLDPLFTLNKLIEHSQKTSDLIA